MTDGRFQYGIAKISAALQIFLCDRIFIHLCIHRRADDLLFVAGEEGRRQHIVGDPVCDLGDHIGAGRNEDEQIGLLGDGYMVDAAVLYLFKCIDDDIVIDQGLKRQRCDELCRILCQDDFDIVVLFDQIAGKLCRLECGNAAGHAQHDGLLHGFAHFLYIKLFDLHSRHIIA